MSASGRLARVVLLAMLLALTVGVMPAYGAYTVISQPDAAYLGSTTKVDISGLTFLDNYSSIGSGFTVTFSHPMQKLGPVPTGWNVESWGTAGDVESQSPDLMFAGDGFGMGDITMTLSQPVTTFGFELAPDLYNVPFNANVDFIASLDGTPVGAVDRTVTNTFTSAGAKLFAISSDMPFDRVDIVFRDAALPDNPPAFSYALAQFRYAFGPEEPDPVVSTPASSWWSLALIGALGLGAAALAWRRATARS